MNSIKLGFCIADLAKSRGVEVYNLRLKDGSSVKKIEYPGRNAVDLFHVKNGRLYGVKGFRGGDENTTNDLVNYIDTFEKLAEDPNEFNAFKS